MLLHKNIGNEKAQSLPHRYFCRSYCDGNVDDLRTLFSYEEKLTIKTAVGITRGSTKENAVKILFIDKHIVVCSKPSGLLSEGESADSLPKLLGDELKARGINAAPLTVHRLDRETAGIMVYALTKKAAAHLSAQFAEGKTEKEYIARAVGKVEPVSGTLTDLIFYDRQKGKSFVVKRERKGVKKAVLNYEVVKYSLEENISTVRIFLETGRTHQIRVQLSSRGYPLVGDRRYGAPPEKTDIPSLVARRLSFLHPETNEPVEFEMEG